MKNGFFKVDRSLLVHVAVRLVLILLVFYVLFGVVFGLTIVHGVSMAPGFKDGDLVLYYRLDKNYVPNETVVVDIDGVNTVRRVIGVSGDTISISDDNELLVNGSSEQNPYIQTPTLRISNDLVYPHTVAENSYFLLSDNRPVLSEDSRTAGDYSQSQIKGKVVAVLMRIRDL